MRRVLEATNEGLTKVPAATRDQDSHLVSAIGDRTLALVKLLISDESERAPYRSIDCFQEQFQTIDRPRELLLSTCPRAQIQHNGSADQFGVAV
jgi:hypothetical protein